MKNKESIKSKSSIPSVTEIVSGMNTVAPRSNKNNRGVSYEAIATEYLLKTINELVNAKEKDGLKEIYIENIKLNYQYKNGKRWYSYLRDNYPLFMMIHPGISMPGASFSSKVKCLPSDVELLEYRLNQDFSSLYEWNQDADTLDIRIDSKNLVYYILDTINRLDKANDSVPEYKHKLVRNAAQALSIKDCAEANGGAMRMSYTMQPNGGRMYMKGLNLQNSPTEVREAALGNCYKYDISSASYAFRLGYIKTNQPSAKTPALLDLVQNKQYIRDKLVKECLTNTKADDKTKLKIIKKSLNAIGFGAKLDTYGSLKKSIWSLSDRTQFCEHPFILELQGELKLFTALLKEEIPNKQAKAMMPPIEGNFTARKFESYVYNRIETAVMENVMENTKKAVIMWCHDAIYTRSKDDLASMNYVLQQQPYMQYAKFEGEEVTAWSNPYAITESYTITPAQEEALAEQYVSNFAQGEGFSKWDQQQLNKQAWRELYEVN